MTDSARTPIAIVGVGAVLPGAPNARSFWDNVKTGVYSITDLPADRWDTRLYYDPDPKAPDKTYSKIGAFVRDFAWDPVAWHIPLPPKVADAMDRGQKWAIAATREALADYGYPERPLDHTRTAVILGNAMGGDRHYLTALRIFFPEIADELAHAPSFAELPAHVRGVILEEMRAGVGRRLPPITEDTMPGELANVVAGRIAAVFDLHGPNFVCDAACASAMAALNAAVQGLDEHAFDAAITGGVDANMSASTYVKFCKIGALSATGTRPFAAGADGFVMGEGAALFLLKRLEDAEKAGDRIYAVVRGVGGASDGRGKGITAPNPAGQRRAIERAWRSAAMAPTTATLIEGHGTSTRVGDVAEMQALTEAFAAHERPAGGRVALGSVKSNIGHLKAAAGAAGLLKTAFALRDKLLPPSLGFQQPNPDIDFERSPFQVNTELRPWRAVVRRAGVSAFGFGGTNFHVVLEEHVPGRGRTVVVVPPPGVEVKPPPRGIFVAGGATAAEVKARLRSARPGLPDPRDLRAPLRVAIDHADDADLAAKIGKAESALDGDSAGVWKALRSQGIYRGAGVPGKIAFLFTGQGSQYVNMLRELRAVEPIVRDTFDEADAIMLPLLGKPLSEIIFAEADRVAAAEEALRQTAVTQPAILTADIALYRLLAARGIAPDMVMGHSLGEYGALVAAGTLPFADALRAVSARGTEMARVSVADNGAMIAVFAPLAEIERTLAAIDGYVVVANVNAPSQAVVGGGTAAVARAAAVFEKAGYRVVPLPVSHAFHTAIVAPASAPMRRTLATLALAPPKLPVISNVTGGFYPETVPEIIELLGRQIAEPVQFVKGLETLYAAGARVFVEVGPKKALAGLAEDVFASHPDAVVVATNHPKLADMVALNQALCALYAAGLGTGKSQEEPMRIEDRATRRDEPEAVVITGAGLGLPGGARVFDDGNVRRILEGAELIDAIPVRLRRAMSDKHVTRLVKSDQPRFEVIDSPADVIKLAARGGALDLAEEFGVPADRVPALDVATRLAIAAGLEALRDAGIPLVMHYKTTTRGTRLPDRWMLPDAVRDETGVIFASAFPGYDAFADNLARHHTDHGRRERLADLQAIRAHLDGHAAPEALAEIDRRVHALERLLVNEPYALDRRFLFRVLSMGHSQFAEYIGARGPNTQINSACASGSLALSLAEDWIRAGRARRVVIVSADDATSDHMLEWVGAGFLASGAAATDDVVEEAAVPFDRRRHGLIIGMGAAAMVVETAEAARARGLVPIVELLGTTCANSAFHGSRLDIEHIAQIMEGLVAGVERRHGLDRRQIASELAFMSHETYTPARGGSAQAEVVALRRVFGADADRIVVANTKGFTGHAMGAAVEEAVAIKMLETGIVPPVANFREVDPDLGPLNLSKGGGYPVRYALRLGAGFGSQIAMGLMRWVPPPDGAHREPEALGYAYRIADRARFDAWLASFGDGDLEVVKRTLRMKDGPAARSTVAPTVAPVPAPKAPPAPAPAPTQLAPVAATAAAPADGIQARVLDIVAGVTGYPPEMLDVDLDLEADLGVDTVKQAETFAAVREAYAIPREATLKLKDFPTLAHVIRWVRQHTAPTPAPAPMPTPAPMPPAPAAAAAPADRIQARVLDIVAGVTGYPPEMLDVDLDLEADLGVDTVKQAETFAAVREAYAIPREATLKLKDFPTLAHVIRWVRQNTAPPPAPVPMPTPVPMPMPMPTPAPPAPAVAAAPATAAAPADGIQARVLDIVAGVTGYPPEMLDVDLDLEADLGVDTVKQAETFAAVREAYAIPREATLKLKDFPTLAHVIRWVRQNTAPTPPTLTPSPTPSPSPSPSPVPALRHRPIAVLRPPLDLCKPTGIALDAGARVLVVTDAGGVGAALAARLSARGVEPVVVEPAAAEGAIGAGGFSGIYWLPALDDEGDPMALAPEAWRAALRDRVKHLHRTVRAFYAALGPGTFLIAATRLGGRHGVDEAGATAPLGGAVTGFVKALKRERPEALIKAVDFDGAPAPIVAEQLVAETLSDRGAVEIGRSGDERFTVALGPAPAAPATHELGRDAVYVVTGAAGSIVSAIIADLCVKGGTFYLLDLAPEPDAGDPDLARLGADRDGLKRDLARRLQERGERATPVAVERALAALERAAAAEAARAAIVQSGGTPCYRRIDLRDRAGVAKIIDEIRARHGRIDVLVHAAGLEISRVVPDKSSEEFDLVFDVKADGWYNLVSAIGTMPLGAIVGFGSIAGRFGNAGQTDYAAANDLLCKLAGHARRSRPETRSLIIDWTAWADLGMATRGSIPKIMAAAGIDMLPAAAGIPVVGAELRAGTRGELVIAGALGVLAAELDVTGGLDLARVAAHGPMLGRVVGWSVGRGLTVETTLDPTVEPFLFDHQIDGKAVLPGVMGIEAFAEIATLLLPAWRLQAIEDVGFHAPFKFYRGEPRMFTIEAQLEARGAEILAACRFSGVRTLAGQEPQTATYFTAQVRLAHGAVTQLAGKLPAQTRPSVGSDAVYRIYFHGPAYQVLASAGRNGSAILGRLAALLPPDHVGGGATVTPARLVELCFQTAGIWEIGTTGQMGLPEHVDRLVVRAAPPAGVPIFAVVVPRVEGGFDARIMDEGGTVFVSLEGYRTTPLGEVDAALLAPLAAAVV